MANKIKNVKTEIETIEEVVEQVMEPVKEIKKVSSKYAARTYSVPSTEAKFAVGTMIPNMEYEIIAENNSPIYGKFYKITGDIYVSANAGLIIS